MLPQEKFVMTICTLELKYEMHISPFSAWVYTLKIDEDLSVVLFITFADYFAV